MARIRSVKPALRTSQVVASWPREIRYFFVLLWGYLDDEGRGLDVPKTIAGDCFPFDDDVTPAKVSRWLDLMAKTKLAPDKEPPVCRYEVGGRRYLHCLNWGEHQRPNRPTPSVMPHCPVHEPLTESDDEPDPEPPLSRQVLEVDSRKLTDGSRKLTDGEPATPARRAQERAARLPDDFAVTAEMVAWATERCPGVNGRHETEKFVNYWRAKSGRDATKLDWPATWRNWMLKAAERVPGNVVALRPSTTDRAVTAGLDLAARLAAEEADRDAG